MKKGFLKRSISILLAAILTISICACGKRDSVDGEAVPGPNSSVAKENVFRCSNFEIPKLGDDYSIDSAKLVDGRVLMIMSIYHWGEGDTEFKILSVNTDGSDLKTLDLEMPETANNRTTSQETEIIAEDAAAADISEDVVSDSFYEYYHFGSRIIMDDGTLHALYTHYKEDYSDPDNQIFENEVSLYNWDKDGRVISEIPLEEASGEGKWINGMYDFGDRIMLLYSCDDGSMYRMFIDNGGNLSKPELCGDEDDIWQSVNYVINKGDGKAYIIYYTMDDYWKEYIAEYDMDAGKMLESFDIPSPFERTGFSSVSMGADNKLIFANNEGLWKYNPGDTEAVMFMNYINSDLASYGLNNVVMIDDEHFIGFYNDLMDYKLMGGYFTKIDPKDIPDKKTLTLGAEYVYTDLKKRVIDFNKTNENYRIVLKQYESYNTNEDYTISQTMRNNDIISGNMPDILYLDSNIPLANYVSKGLIMDIDKLISEDPELSGVEFLQNAFDAFRIDGKLYQVMPSFNVRTITGKKSIVGDRTAWDMDDFMELNASLGENSRIFGDYMRDGFLYTMMSFCGSDFVDVSTGKCDFNSDNFIKMLEFANTLPTEQSNDYYNEDYWMNYESQYREDRTILMETYIGSMQSMSRYINGSFGEEVSFIGFPTSSGKGTIISSNSSYIISAKSKNVDGAWEFLRYYLTEEYQTSEEAYGIPVTKSAYDAWLEKGKHKPYYIDGDGNKVEYDDYYYMNGEDFELPVLTDAQVKQISDLILSADKQSYYNEDVTNIINEEAAAFFNNQKSAKEVADIIQSRVQLYVNENR